MSGPVSRETRRRRSGVAQAWLTALAFLGGWVVARGYVAALVAWPLLVPEAVALALLGWGATRAPAGTRVTNREVSE